MLNTIQRGDRVIASRLAYVKDDPQRYDIVILSTRTMRSNIT